MRRGGGGHTSRYCSPPAMRGTPSFIRAASILGSSFWSSRSRPRHWAAKCGSYCPAAERDGCKTPSVVLRAAAATSRSEQQHLMSEIDQRTRGEIDAVIAGLAGAGYIASRSIATAVFLARHLHKPILVEGPAGVGKTELAKASAAFLGLPLIRMQCYDGLDEAKALYEWKYAKQLLYTQILKDKLGEELNGVKSL